MNLSAQCRGDGDVAANLNDVDIESFAAEKSALFGDIKIDGGNAAARIEKISFSAVWAGDESIENKTASTHRTAGKPAA